MSERVEVGMTGEASPESPPAAAVDAVRAAWIPKVKRLESRKRDLVSYLSNAARGCVDDPESESFGAFARKLAGWALGLDPQEVTSALRRADEHVPEMLDELESVDLAKGAAHVPEAIAYVCVSRCMGGAPSGVDDDFERTWLDALIPYAPKLTPQHRRELAFAAAAIGADAALAAFDGGGPLADSLPAATSFEDDVPGFVRFLATAVARGSAPAAVEPAWLEFVRLAPERIEAKQLGDVEVLCAARAFHGGVSGVPVGETLRCLRELVLGAG